MTAADRTHAHAHRLLDLVLGEDPPPFALLWRPRGAAGGAVEVMVGDVTTPGTLEQIPLPSDPVDGPRADVLALVPYRQISERGFECVDDGTELVALSVADQAVLPVDALLARMADEPLRISGEAFDLDDDAYAAIVRTVVDREIGTGEGANFVIKRTYSATIADYSPRAAVTLFLRMLVREPGAYWSFAIHTGTRTLVGATPERHVSLDEGVAWMNPISGTYRYPESGPTVPGVLDFLGDPKETDELYMVVDEELKMMSRVCDSGARVQGPLLKCMADLAHTEYYINGHTDLDPRTILRETLFAPTVTGSPLESACRVLAKYEPAGRGYYSGVFALIGRDGRGRRTLDSAIAIRTADIDEAGLLRLSVGATLVRHSDPYAEAAETRAKADGLVKALRGERAVRSAGEAGAVGRALAADRAVCGALERRNQGIAKYWFDPADERDHCGTRFAGMRALIIDAEDTFTAMLGQQLGSLGLKVEVRRFDEHFDLDEADLVVLGPGPGDPRDLTHPKIRILRETAGTLLRQRRALLAVCLSHQVISHALGLDLRRLPAPNQGVQRAVELFGSREAVGFYNTFSAYSAVDEVEIPDLGTLRLSRDPQTGAVHAMRGPGFATAQFHPESVLTVDGPGILAGMVREVLPLRTLAH
ncbi:chorismate-binding protein [Actinospica durhamensis]|uniref:anthranilate synthase n=1 Tax=Actinospica durhamensis TaxID=1508375 RepID=A0A941F021_9ACTN|nr:anthranilate synthase family protein [Actinospica durhamensis]MBR7837619.1 chorismate-binding protein [Actinospica durhamensis]